jgi:hypothetical protein
MKILILTRPDNASLKVSAYSLKGTLSELNVEADINYHIGV